MPCDGARATRDVAGAFVAHEGGAAQPIKVRHPAADPLVIVGSRSHRGASLDSVLERIGAHEMRPMGSSLKFCLVAEGTADFYPRLGPTCGAGSGAPITSRWFRYKRLSSR